MNTLTTLTPLEAVNSIRDDNHGQVVLVLQGVGALGAYQGGVYQALHESGVEPDWIIGPPIACSSSTDWRRPARTTAKQSFIKAEWLSSRMPSSLTGIISSSAGRCSRCVAIPGEC